MSDSDIMEKEKELGTAFEIARLVCAAKCKAAGEALDLARRASKEQQLVVENARLSADNARTTYQAALSNYHAAWAEAGKLPLGAPVRTPRKSADKS